MALLITLLAGLGTGALFFVVRDLMSPEATSLRRRLAEEFEKEKQGTEANSPLFKNLDRVVLGSAKPALTSPQWRVRMCDCLKDWLEQASIPLTPIQWLLISGTLGLIVGVVAAWFRGPVFCIAGIAAGLGSPWGVLLMRCKARRETMLKQLPSVFDLMARAIRAGQSVPQAMQAVGDSFKGPLAAEFTRCQKQLNLGLAPEIAFAELASRTGIVEMRIFVMALLIQRQVGGSLGETMDRLAATVRSRLSLRNQVRTLTAEGRLQGWTLVVLPFVLFAAMMVMNRPYAEVLLDHGRLIALALASMTVGILWIRRIVNFEI